MAASGRLDSNVGVERFASAAIAFGGRGERGLGLPMPLPRMNSFVLMFLLLDWTRRSGTGQSISLNRFRRQVAQTGCRAERRLRRAHRQIGPGIKNSQNLQNRVHVHFRASNPAYRKQKLRQ
jgi:hypothetical protein